jgi:RNA polymerase sigma-70 factor (ECF subfamily)
MNAYDEINKQLNDEMQALAEKINGKNYTEKDRNRLASIMYPKLKFFIWKFFKDQPEASIETEEALHNTLFKIFKGHESYNDDYRFTTWIYTIARNEALLHKHKITRQITVKLDSLTHPPVIEDNSSSNLEREEYLNSLFAMTHAEMFALPECIEKDILIDKEINQMKGNDIAVKYDMNLNTVKTKIRKARKMLRDRVLENNPHMREQINEYF